MLPPKLFRLYFHIPYCRQLCHYCDFAKTALYNPIDFEFFFRKLTHHFLDFYEWLSTQYGEIRFDSLYLGGGTPSLFGEEYRELFGYLTPFLSSNAEITLEANPLDISRAMLSEWRRLGINRLSLGIQSLAPKGLEFLTRTHQVPDIYRSLELSSRFFDNINVDLIYGWPGQTQELWQKELTECAQLPVQHFSLYNLTYESKTPIGRRAHRGILKIHDDDTLFTYYRVAMETLADNAFMQEEVSNWHKEGFAAQHNRGYWNMDFYLGIGPGAHGFLPSLKPLDEHDRGLRYSYPKSDKLFLKMPRLKLRMGSLNDSLPTFGLAIDERDDAAWLMESISMGCRSTVGVNIPKLEKRIKKYFHLSPFLDMALEKKLLKIDSSQHLTLNPQEWFREQAWTLKIFECFY